MGSFTGCPSPALAHCRPSAEAGAQLGEQHPLWPPRPAWLCPRPVGGQDRLLGWVSARAPTPPHTRRYLANTLQPLNLLIFFPAADCKTFPPLSIFAGVQANFFVLPYKQKEQSPYPMYDNGHDHSPSSFMTTFAICTRLSLPFAAETLFLGRNLKLTVGGKGKIRSRNSLAVRWLG